MDEAAARREDVKSTVAGDAKRSWPAGGSLGWSAPLMEGQKVGKHTIGIGGPWCGFSTGDMLRVGVVGDRCMTRGVDFLCTRMTMATAYGN